MVRGIANGDVIQRAGPSAPPAEAAAAEPPSAEATAEAATAPAEATAPEATSSEAAASATQAAVGPALREASVLEATEVLVRHAARLLLAVGPRAVARGPEARVAVLPSAAVAAPVDVAVGPRVVITGAARVGVGLAAGGVDRGRVRPTLTGRVRGVVLDGASRGGVDRGRALATLAGRRGGVVRHGAAARQIRRAARVVAAFPARPVVAGVTAHVARRAVGAVVATVDAVLLLAGVRVVAAVRVVSAGRSRARVRVGPAALHAVGAVGLCVPRLRARRARVAEVPVHICGGGAAAGIPVVVRVVVHGRGPQRGDACRR